MISGMARLQQTCTHKVTYVAVAVIKVACLAVTGTKLFDLVLQSLRWIKLPAAVGVAISDIPASVAVPRDLHHSQLYRCLHLLTFQASPATEGHEPAEHGLHHANCQQWLCTCFVIVQASAWGCHGPAKGEGDM